MKFNEEDIILCTECDAEFTVNRLDDGEEEVEFCPICGHHLWEELDEDNDDDPIDSVYYND